MRNFWLINVLVLGALLLLSGAVSAGGGSSSSSSYIPVCSPNNNLDCLNGVSTSVTNGANLRVGGAQYGDVGNERTKQQQLEASTGSAAESGVAAGDFANGWSIWGSYTRSDLDSDFIFANSSLAYSAKAQSALAGVDALITERFLIGFALGYQDLSSKTYFNGGGQDSDGIIISPYGAFIINDNFSIDVGGGYSDLEYDQTRISPGVGTPTVGSFDANRWFFTTNLNAVFVTGDWVIGGRFGYLYTEEDQDGYTETGAAARTVADRNIDLSQLVLGGDLAYSVGPIEPYVSAVYRNDLSKDDGESAGGLPGAFTSVQPSDDDEFQVGLGVRYFSNYGVSANLEYSLTEGRDSFSDSTLLLTLRREM
jgi:uncharacterized protein YhjY with autotransporter beta-barrel domain